MTEVPSWHQDGQEWHDPLDGLDPREVALRESDDERATNLSPGLRMFCVACGDPLRGFESPCGFHLIAAHYSPCLGRPLLAQEA